MLVVVKAYTDEVCSVLEIATQPDSQGVAAPSSESLARNRHFVCDRCRCMRQRVSSLQVRL